MAATSVEKTRHSVFVSVLRMRGQLNSQSVCPSRRGCRSNSLLDAEQPECVHTAFAVGHDAAGPKMPTNVRRICFQLSPNVIFTI